MRRRNCQTVIAQMIEKIPSSEIELLKDLKWNFDDAGYKAPEETLQWSRTMQTLQKHIPDPSKEWHYEVLSIFTTHPIELLKQWSKEEQQIKEVPDVH